MRVVLDTNVLISAFVFPGGAPEHVYRRALEGRITLVTSRPLLSELGRILAGMFDWEPTHAEEVVAQLVRIPMVVDPIGEITDITDDPPDNRVLEAASEGKAEAIVSGDRHLLTLENWRGVRVMAPAVALNELE